MDKKDKLFDKAVQLSIRCNSLRVIDLQRSFNLGYAHAYKIIQDMVKGGWLREYNGSCYPVIKPIPANAEIEQVIPGAEAAR